MTIYQKAVRDFQTRFLLDAIRAANGNQSRAAKSVGVHRNTMSRQLTRAGYTGASIRDLLRMEQLVARRKGPVPETWDGAAARRSA